MNKFNKILIALSILTILYWISSVFNWFIVYKNNTITNEPTLKENLYMMVSSLVKPKVGSFVCYKFNDSVLGKHIRTHRMVAKQGDVIKIIDGNLYVNDTIFSTNYLINKAFSVRCTDLQKIMASKELNYKYVIENINNDTCIVSLNKVLIDKYNIKASRRIIDDSIVNPEIERTYLRKWNNDNFGEVTVPKGKVFVLGDNRPISLDSRHIGYINEEDIVGVVIY